VASFEALPEWEKLLAAERHVQHLIPGAILVGGTAAALHLGHRQLSFDDLYRQPGGASPLSEVAERLAQAHPSDYADLDLGTYRGLSPPWTDWAYLSDRGRAWAVLVARIAMEEPR
jgi:hypothetical protein